MVEREPVCGYTFNGVRCRRRGPHRCTGRVKHVLAFFATLLVHTKGDWAGRPFIPAAWQRDRVIAPLFGQVVYDPARGRYVRQYRTLYLSIARKNGKTELLAALTLYLLVADGEVGAEVYGLALDRDQAGLVYQVARQMVRRNRVLDDRLQVVASTGRIVDELAGSFYSVVAGDAAGALGMNPSAAYIDELLTQPDRDLYDAIRTGQGARAQPILMLATTAENDPGGFAATEREWSERVALDPQLEPERLVVIYSTSEEDDWTAPTTWAKANPALGDFLDLRTIAAECHTAQGNPAAERAFRQYRLNQPVGRVGQAIATERWDASAGVVGHAQLETALAGRVAFAGLDLAATSDLAAYALVFPDDTGGLDALWRHFVPGAALRDLNRRTGGRADQWVGEGLLTVTPGNAIDYRSIITALEHDRERFDIQELAFDPWGAIALSTSLLDDGWPMVKMGQSFASMAAPTADLLRAVQLGTFHHGGNPLVRWQVEGAAFTTDSAGNVKFAKNSSKDKIDGLVAAVMALDRASRHQTATDYAVAGFR